MIEKIIVLDDIQKIILRLVEIDQEAATLETYYRIGSRDKVMKRVEESIGALMQLHAKVKALTPDSYIDKEKDK